MRRVLMIAAMFPPENDSGTHRPFHFAKHLRDFGYDPTVVAMLPEDVRQLERGALAELEGRCAVRRVLPVGFHRRAIQSLLGRDIPLPPASTPQPDAQTPEVSASRKRQPSHLGPRWMLSLRHRLRADDRTRFQPMIWALTAGGLAVHRHRPVDLVWATGCPWASLMAGYLVAAVTGQRLVLDIRDPWTYGFLAREIAPAAMPWNKRWEHRVLRRAARTIYTSPLTTAIMQQRVSPGCARRMITITNGFAGTSVVPQRPVGSDKLLFCYTGKIRWGIRDPRIILEALQRVVRDPDVARDVRFCFVGNMVGYDAVATNEYDLKGTVLYTGQVSSDQALAYMHGADVLVLLQMIPGAGSDAISGKAYEYLAARKPIMGVVHPSGGDAWLLRTTGAGTITGIDDPGRIADVILDIWRRWRDGALRPFCDEQMLARFDRHVLTRDLAAVFDEVLQ